MIRLGSVLGGAAKRGSERLKTLEEDAKKLITTEAARVGQELAANRKARTKAKLDYGMAARKLRRFGLGDAQIEAVLAGGLEGADLLEKSVSNAQTRAELAGQKFDDVARTNAISALLPVVQKDVAGRGIDDQAIAFANLQVPQMGGFDQGLSQVTKAISAMSPAGLKDSSFIRDQLTAQTTALGGGGVQDAAFTGQAFGTQTGFGFTPDVTDMDAILKAKALQAQTEYTGAKTQTEIQMLPVNIDEKRASISATLSQSGLTQARTEEILGMLPLNMMKTSADIELIGKNIEKVDATIAQMGVENDQIRANTALLSQRLTKLAVETNILNEYGDEEMEAKILQMNTSSGLNAIRQETLEEQLPFVGDKAKADVDRITAAIGTEELTQEKLQADIDLLNTYGAQEKEAALALIESRILKNGSYADLEAFQVSMLAENKRLEAMLNETEDDVERDNIQRQIQANNDRIGSSSLALSDTEGFEELLNKGAAPTVFNHILKQSLQGQDVKQEFTSLQQVLGNIEEGARPQYFAGLIRAVGEFESVYGKDKQGAKFVSAKRFNINSMLADYSRRAGEEGKGLNAGEIDNEGKPVTQGVTLSEGSVGYIPNAAGGRDYMIYTGNKFIRVD